MSLFASIDRFDLVGRNVSSDGNSEPSRIAGGENRQQYLQREPWRGGAVLAMN